MINSRTRYFKAVKCAFGKSEFDFILLFCYVLCHWQLIFCLDSPWRPQQLSQACFVCWTGHNGLPVAVEPPSPLRQSELSTDQHSVQHNAGLLPCEQRTSVNRRENGGCLEARRRLTETWWSAEKLQASENKLFYSETFKTTCLGSVFHHHVICLW